LLRNSAQQTYTFPKKELDEALSAQICSLSAKVVEDCLETMTGSFQAFASPPAAAATSSVRETAIASNPLNLCSQRVAPTYEVRFA
jgi:hypothetical protein